MVFLNPGKLQDDDLVLELAHTNPGDDPEWWAPSYGFFMRHATAGCIMGRVDLRIGNSRHIIMYGGHIGYEVDSRYRGHRYAARAVRLLLGLARKHRLDPIWITCNPENTASRRTCELAGGVYVDTVELPRDTDLYEIGERFKCRYRFDIP